jgi:hypothetical protein
MRTLLGSSNTPFTFVNHTLIASQPETIVQYQTHLLPYTVLYFVQYHSNRHYHKDLHTIHPNLQYANILYKAR